jgi:hypothetical protein
MSHELWGLGTNKTEKMFYQAVYELGLDIQPNPTIRAPYPVADKHGIIQKVVTNPDFIVRDHPNKLYCYVEVTVGSGNTPSKLAQQRVVEAAKEPNYVQLHGDEVANLFFTNDLTQRQLALFQYLGWLDQFN